MNLLQVLSSENFYFYIVEASDQNRFIIDNGVLDLLDISEVDMCNQVILPTKSDLEKYGKIVEAFVDEKYPDIEIEFHKPGVSRRLEKLGLKYDYMEFERRYLKIKMLEWLQTNSEYKDVIVPENLIFA